MRRMSETIFLFKASSGRVLISFLWLLFLLMISSCDGPADISYENGIEVVSNKAEPNKINKKRINFSLEEINVIDLENPEFLEKGMGSAGEFDVDSDGNIYIVGWKNKEYYINKIDKTGNLILSFGRRGEGPGEINTPIRPTIYNDHFFVIADMFKKLIYYDVQSGRCVREILFKTPMLIVECLPNNKFLVYKSKNSSRSKEIYFSCLNIYDDQWKMIKELDVYEYPPQEELGLLAPYFMWRVSNQGIFIVNEKRGYEIQKFDHDGRLLRKIKKEYRPVRLSEELEKEIAGPNYQVDRLYQGKKMRYLAPMNSIFCDDQERFFVMTYEKSDTGAGFIHNVFNADGLYIGDLIINKEWAGIINSPKYTMIKNNKLYYYREKADGFKELVVCHIKYE